MNMNGSTVKGNFNRDALFAIKLSKFITWPLGIWPLHCDDLFSWIRCCASIILQFWLTWEQFLVIVHNCGDFDYLVDDILIGLCSIMAISKIVSLRIYAHDMYTIFTSIFEIRTNTKEEKRRATILKPFTRIGCLLACLQITLTSITIIIIMKRPLNGVLFNFMSQATNETQWNNASEVRVRTLPLHSDCLYGELKYSIYILTYILEFIAICLCGQGNVGVSVFIFKITMVLSGHFAVLKDDIMKINTKLNETDKLEEEIHLIIQKHSKLLHLAELLNKTTSEILLIELILNCGVNLALGMRLLVALKLGQTIMRVIISFSIMMFQLFLLNYAGEYLTNQTETVLDCLYDINWYELPIKSQKDLCFMIMRANKPVYRLAGRFYVLNYEHFKNILKACFSLFNIFRLMFKV